MALQPCQLAFYLKYICRIANNVFSRYSDAERTRHETFGKALTLLISIVYRAEHSCRVSLVISLKSLQECNVEVTTITRFFN